MITLHTQAELPSLLGAPELPHLNRATWPYVSHRPQVEDYGCDKSFSSVRSAKFATQWTLECRVPD